MSLSQPRNPITMAMATNMPNDQHPDHSQHPSHTPSTLRGLYTKFQETLEDSKMSMQDSALDIVVEIESAIQSLLANDTSGAYTLDPRRSKRYGLSDASSLSSIESPFRARLASEAQVMERFVGRGLSTQHLLSQITRIRERVSETLKTKSPQEIAQELGIIYTLHRDGRDQPFVPTREDARSIEIGSGSGFDRAGETAPKLSNILSLLWSIETPEGGHIDPRDIIMDLQDTTPDSMLRRTPYTVIRIPRLHRTILVDDEIGEATFVLMGLTDLEDIRSCDKRELQSRLSAQRVIYDDRYTDKIHAYLLSDWERVSMKEGESDENENSEINEDISINFPTTESNPITPRVAVDKMILFLDRSVIKKDLEGFLKEASPNSLLTDLTSSNPSGGTKITLSNGEVMTWGTYLRRASAALLRTENHSKEHGHKKGQALVEILKMVGVILIDESYFQKSNKEVIKKDLEGFLKEANPNNSLTDLTTKNPPQNTKIMLPNGEEMAWQAYLRRASAALLGTTDGSKENGHKVGPALTRLLEMIGAKKKIILIDKTYFTESNKATIEQDLAGFLAKAKVNSSLADLTSINPSPSTKVTLSNGEEMTWQTYLCRASAALLGTTQGSKENGHKVGPALTRLLEMIGAKKKIILIDKTYFTESNKATIEQDLEGFLSRAYPNNSLTDLLSTNPSQSTKVTLSNGQEMTWDAYLKRASGALLGTVHGSEKNGHKIGQALVELLKMIGVILIDASYFTESNKETIKKDLEGFLKEANPNNSLADLLCTNPPLSTKVTLSNGQEMTWNTYLCRASVALLGTVQGSKENGHKIGQALVEILKMVGVNR